MLVAAYTSYVAAAKIKGKWDSILLARKKLLVTWSKAHQIALMREALAMKEGTASTKLMAAAQLLLAGNLRPQVWPSRRSLSLWDPSAGPHSPYRD